MRPENVVVVARREYLQRIKTKGFWIGTLLVPVFIAASTFLPLLLLSKSRTTQRIVVVDETGQVGPELAAGRVERRKDADFDQIAEFKFQLESPRPDRREQQADLDRRVLDEEIDAWVWVGRGVLADEPFEYHARSVSNMLTQEVLRDDVSAVVRRVRLRRAGLDPERVGKLTEPVRLESIRVSEEGSRAEGGAAGMLFALGLFLTLFMAMFVWGQQVMNGVLEEKGSRVIEVVISSVRPFELLMGKLVGICLLGLTQLSIWLGTVIVVTAPGILASLAVLPEGVNLPTVTPAMVAHLVILFILGFFSFATLYAAIGAAFNNLQEAQQVAGTAGFFLMIPLFLIHPVINDPNSRMAVVMSLIPLFTPLLMSLRVSLDMPPLWQLLLSYVLTVGFTWVMVWACARIYRIGILMYGKKPTIQELWKWVRYA